jgi:hypothetical protein
MTLRRPTTFREDVLLPDVAARDLRELVRLRARFLQNFGDWTRQLHRAVDLSFPEFTRYVVQLDSPRATTLLRAFPTPRRRRPAAGAAATAAPGAGKVARD